MSFLRWAPTVFGFPIGGWIAILLVGPVSDPLSGAFAGAVAGSVIGGLQWLALGRRVNWRWLAGTSIGMAMGIALAAILTNAATGVGVLALTGLVSGASVGAAQAFLQRWSARHSAVWITAVGLGWAAGWAISANVITDVDRGYVTFGLSGSALVTIATGLAMRWILRSRAMDQRVDGSADGSEESTQATSEAHR